MMTTMNQSTTMNHSVVPRVLHLMRELQGHTERIFDAEWAPTTCNCEQLASASQVWRNSHQIGGSFSDDVSTGRHSARLGCRRQ